MRASGPVLRAVALNLYFLPFATGTGAESTFTPSQPACLAGTCSFSTVLRAPPSTAEPTNSSLSKYSLSPGNPYLACQDWSGAPSWSKEPLGSRFTPDWAHTENVPARSATANKEGDFMIHPYHAPAISQAPRISLQNSSSR